jgi:hypothetical protein
MCCRERKPTRGAGHLVPAVWLARSDREELWRKTELEERIRRIF